MTPAQQREKVLREALKNSVNAVYRDEREAIATKALAAADAIPDAPGYPTMRGDVEPCLRTASEMHELFPRLEALSNRLFQTQGLILSALASAGLTVVPLEPTARTGRHVDPSMKWTSSLTTGLASAESPHDAPEESHDCCHVCGRDDVGDIGDHVRWHLDVPKCEGPKPVLSAVSSAGSLSSEQLKVALKNIGYDLECGACAEVFYCGMTTATHECKPVPSRAELIELMIATLEGQRFLSMLPAPTQIRVSAAIRERMGNLLDALKEAGVVVK